MPFHIIRIEVSRKKEPLNTMALPRRFAAADDAEAEIRAMAASYAKHGENPKEGYWWYEDQKRRYWLLVKNDDE